MSSHRRKCSQLLGRAFMICRHPGRATKMKRSPHGLCLSWTVLVQSLSHVWLFLTPWIAAYQAFLSITNSQSLPKLKSIESVITSNHLILCHPLLLLPSIFCSIRVFSSQFFTSGGQSIRVSASASVLPMNIQDWWLISFRMDRLDLLAVQGTLKSLLQHHSLKAPILQHSNFYLVQLSHLYMTSGKTKTLD